MNEKEMMQLNRLNKIFNTQMLTKENVANYLNISLSSVSNLMEKGELVSIKLSHEKRSSVRICIEDFARYLAKLDLDNNIKRDEL